MTVSNNLYIDAVIVKGESKTHSVSIQQRTEDGLNFEPFDLSDYYIKFKVLGSATLDALVLIEKDITQSSDIDTVGNIEDAANGLFNFTITAKDTAELGIGKFPIAIQVCDIETNEVVFTLTEGGYKGEFSKLQIIQV